MTRAKEAEMATPQQTSGLVLNWGWRYDLTVWVLDVFLGGKLREIRQRALDMAELQEGDAVLDVGCGTGTLALEARERVGQAGRVAAIDPAPQQIARSRSKAARRGLEIDFRPGVIERVPFPEQTFDVVMSTWVMHHLPDELKRQGLSEIARVLKPAGRLVIVDSMHRGHGRHVARMGVGQLDAGHAPALMKEAGFSAVETENVRLTRLPGFPRARFVRGRKPPDSVA